MQMTKTNKMKCTEKEFLEWKITFLEEQLENVHINLEYAGETDADYRELLYENGRNIKVWIKELKK